MSHIGKACAPSQVAEQDSRDKLQEQIKYYEAVIKEYKKDLKLIEASPIQEGDLVYHKQYGKCFFYSFKDISHSGGITCAVAFKGGTATTLLSELSLFTPMVEALHV